MCMQQLIDQTNTFKRNAALLNHPTVKRLARLHPDAEWSISTWNRAVYGDVSISVRTNEPWDISALPDVTTNTHGYSLTTTAIDKKIKLRGDPTPYSVVVRVNADQRFTEEEKDLLRAVGKLTRITENTSYEALVCK